MGHGPDGGAVQQGPSVRGTTTSPVSIHRIPHGTQREAAMRNAAITAEKRPGREANSVETDNDPVARMGFETHDLYLKGQVGSSAPRPY